MFDSRPAPPKNVEAEQGLLAAIFATPLLLEAVRDRLAVEHFAEPLNAAIYGAILAVADRGAVPSPPAILPIVGAEHKAYIAGLFAAHMAPTNAPYYVDHIVECWQRREALEAIRDTEAALGVLDPERPALAILEEAEQRLYEIAEKRAGETRGPVSVAVAADEAIARNEWAYKNKGKLAGVTTGLSDLDHALGGLVAGEVTVLAGRPGMGKTTMAKTAVLAAARSGAPAILFSKEMPRATVAQWLLADITGISAERQRRGELTNADFDDLREARQMLAQLPFEIDDSAGLSMGAIRARARRFKRRQKGLGLLAIDHIGLVKPSKEARRNGSVAALTETTNAIKELAKELQCPILALSQLNRNVEQRDDKRPGLADLRDSGSVEQDADVVILCYREEYYRRGEEPQRKPGEKDEKYDQRMNEWREAMINCKGLAELIVAKNRSGAPTTVRVKFNPERSRMENLVRYL